MWTTDLEWFNPHNFHNRPWQSSHRNGSMEHQFNLRRSMTHTSWEQSSTSMLEPSHPFPQLNPGSSGQHPVQAPPKPYFNPLAPEHISYVNAHTPKLTFHTTYPYYKPHSQGRLYHPTNPLHHQDSSSKTWPQTTYNHHHSHFEFSKCQCCSHHHLSSANACAAHPSATWIPQYDGFDHIYLNLQPPLLLHYLRLHTTNYSTHRGSTTLPSWLSVCGHTC